MGSSQFTLNGDVLYKIESDKTLRIVPPAVDRPKLFEELHGGLFQATCEKPKFLANFLVTTGGRTCVVTLPPCAVPV